MFSKINWLTFFHRNLAIELRKQTLARREPIKRKSPPKKSTPPQASGSKPKAKLNLGGTNVFNQESASSIVQFRWSQGRRFPNIEV